MFKKKSLNDILTDQRFIRIAVIAACAAILLIFLSSFIKFPSSGDKDTEQYTIQLHDQLLSIVTRIDGVGEAEIFLTIDNAGESVYLSNSDTKTKSIEPTVRGVVIVCDGGDDPIVVSRVLSAVTRSLSISSDKVCVTKLSNINQQ